jgi:DnaJ-class molecular chaperone
MKTSSDSNGVKTCPDCNGDGVVDKDTDDERQCPTCGGLGFVRDDDKDHEEVIKTRVRSASLVSAVIVLGLISRYYLG